MSLELMGFYSASDVLIKKCNLLQTEKREDLCLKLNQDLEIQLDKIQFSVIPRTSLGEGRVYRVYS